MDLASRLEQAFDKLRVADKEHINIRYELSANQFERQYAEAIATAHRNELNEIIDLIKMHEVLVLHTVEQTRVFTRLLPEHFNDRGILDRVEMGEFGYETRQRIRILLVEAGLTKGDQSFFHFPA